MNNRIGRGRSAFTLIELLVVIGIIGVIAAILLPVFAGIRERGRRTQCLSNERQLGMAIMQYVQDNGEQFPNGRKYTGDDWVSQVSPYVKDRLLFHCPDDSTEDADYIECSYGFSSNLGHTESIRGASGQRTLHSAGYGLAILTAPAETVLLFEVGGKPVIPSAKFSDGSIWGSGGLQGCAAGDSAGQPLTDTTFPCGSRSGGDATYAMGNIGGRLLNGATKDGKALDGAAGSKPRHGVGANYVACDGHVRWLRPEMVSGGASAASSDCPQGTETPQPAGCEGQQKDQAAGTASGRYAMTFSSK